MNLPFFYIKSIDTKSKSIVLDGDTSRHIVQVLRMKEGEKMNLTDGKGNLISAAISDPNKKHCGVEVKGLSFKEEGTGKISIAISLLKNTNRFEWFLEKATEIGVTEIIPLICERTEKEKFRFDRMQQICISAMLQSQQSWLPKLHDPLKYTEYIKSLKDSSGHQKFIAHCEDENKQSLQKVILSKSVSPADRDLIKFSHILIGPEGDFSKEEINLALENHFVPVSLGDTRLRSETAGMVAATLLGL